jgi:hypothetical protein
VTKGRRFSRRVESERALRELKYDRDLVFAAGPCFDSNRVDIAMDDELLMLLVSDLVDETEIGRPTIMDVDTHINELKRKERDDLKQPYWDRELAKDHQVMDVFPKLNQSNA